MKRAFRYFDFSLLFAVLSLVGLSTVMIYSASVWNMGEEASTGLFKRQLLFVAIGLIVYIVATFFRYEHFQNTFFLTALAVVTFFLLAATLGMRELNGARAWLIIGSFTLQPIEIVKFVSILLLANYYDRIHTKNFQSETLQIMATGVGNNKGWFGRSLALILVPGVLLLPYIIVILLQPDMGGLFVLVLLTFFVMFAAGAPKRVLGASVILGSTAVYYFYDKIFSQNQIQRIQAVINPFLDAEDKGHQLIMSLISIAHGGLTGVGLGNSYQKYGHLPEPETDYIMSIIAEELGYLGVMFVLIILFFIMFRAAHIANHSTNHFSMLVAFGISAQLFVQSTINIAAMSGWFPGTGVTLPLVSYGGTSLIMTMGILGVLSGISMRNRQRRDQEKDQLERIPLPDPSGQPTLRVVKSR